MAQVGYARLRKVFTEIGIPGGALKVRLMKGRIVFQVADLFDRDDIPNILASDLPAC